MEIHKRFPEVTITNETIVSLDLEMYGQDGSRLHRPHGEFACLSVCIGEDVWVVTEVGTLSELFKLLQPAKYWVFYNAMYDIRQLRRFVEIKQRPIWDASVVEHLLWGGYYATTNEFALADCTRRYLNIKLDKSTRQLFEKYRIMDNQMLEYAATDPYLTDKVRLAQVQEIEKRNYNMRTYWEIEEPTIWATLDFKPVKVNVDRWRTMVQELSIRGRAVENDLGVNVNSHEQLKAFVLQNTGVKLDNAQEETLLNNAGKIGKELVDKILLTKSLRKAESTYGEKWLSRFVEEGDLVYADFHTMGTETGRFSASNPPIQTIPTRKIPEYRQLFISNKGKLIVADAQAQEPRILAYLSGDKALRKIFDEGKDVHTIVTRAIFNDETIQKSDPRRDREGKTINLASSYGLSARGLADKLNIELSEAETFLRNYFNKFSGVAMFRDRMYSQANRFEYVESISGRRVYINKHNRQWQNNSINAPIQSSAADLFKAWLCEIHRVCGDKNIFYPVVMVVHDEIVLDVEMNQVQMYEELLHETFQSAAAKWFVGMPFILDVHKGKSWACKRTEEDIDI